MIEKVTAFIVRSAENGSELLIFKHPNAGLQVPAGTVEENETPDDAVLREIFEETGLKDLKIEKKLGTVHQFTPQDEGILTQKMRLFGWPAQAAQRVGPLYTRGMHFQIFEKKVGFSRVRYEEYDLDQSPPQLLHAMDGWLPSSVITHEMVRHFYLVRVNEETPSKWSYLADLGYTFLCHWVPLKPAPVLIGEQSDWLKFLDEIDLDER